MTTPSPENLTEAGRRLASERDDLIAAGVGPATLAVPLAPDPFPWESVADYVHPPEDDDVVDAEILCEDPDCFRGPIAHPWDPDTGCPGPRAEDVKPFAVELSAAVLDSRAAFLLLDDLAQDTRRRETAGRIRETLGDVVRRRAAVRAADRPDKVTSATDVRLEVVGLGDDAETLDALAGAFTAAAQEARSLAGDLIDEVPRARVSIKVADGQGFELTVKREQRRELSVAFDDVVDVLIASRLDDRSDRHGSGLAAYSAGMRDGIAALREVLSTSPTFRSTALDSLATRLEDAGEDALAKRLRAAYARVDVGDPRVKLERTPIKPAKGGDQ